MKTRKTETHPLRTLGVDLGMHEIGYAGLEQEEVKTFGVHTIKIRTSRKAILRDAERFIQNLITFFKPNVVVIEKTRYPRSKRSPALHDFGDAIRRYAQRQGMTVLSYTPIEVKEALTGNSRTTKEELAPFLLREWYPNHPGLWKRLRTDVRNKERYWQNLFDALALAMVGYQKIARRTIPNPSPTPGSTSITV